VSVQVCGFFLIVVVAIVLIALRSNTSWFTDLSDQDTPTLNDISAFGGRSAHDEHAGFDAIKNADPNFTIEAFKERVAEMFLALHSAAIAGDLAPTQRFVDPQLYRRFTAQVDQERAVGALPTVTSVRDLRPVMARHDDGLDLVRSEIVADRADGGTVVEYWELVRRRGTTSKPEMTIYRCPNCGAPIDGDDPARCAYCDTRLADPAFDWVVRRISTE
jgi:hypothetical protein